MSTNYKKEYIDKLVQQLIREIAPPNNFKEFVDNTDLLGKYVESAVRAFIKKIIYNGKVSTGGVISPELQIAKNQIDIIIWKPNPFPAIFESENFAIIPRNSVFGIIEVKSSNYNGVKVKIDKFYDDELFKMLVKEEESNIEKNNIIKRLLVVICLYDSSKDNSIRDLVKQEKCIILYELDKENKPIPNEESIIKFIEYLIYLQYDLSTTFQIFKGFN